MSGREGEGRETYYSLEQRVLVYVLRVPTPAHMHARHNVQNDDAVYRSLLSRIFIIITFYYFIFSFMLRYIFLCFGLVFFCTSKLQVCRDGRLSVRNGGRSVDAGTEQGNTERRTRV